MGAMAAAYAASAAAAAAAAAAAVAAGVCGAESVDGRGPRLILRRNGGKGVATNGVAATTGVADAAGKNCVGGMGMGAEGGREGGFTLIFTYYILGCRM